MGIPIYMYRLIICRAELITYHYWGWSTAECCFLCGMLELPQKPELTFRVALEQLAVHGVVQHALGTIL